MITVLIVEDDKFARQGIIQTLPWSKYDMKVTGEASSGKAAIELLEKESFQLILSDYSMPGMNGLELLRYVRNRYPDTLFAMLTLYETFDIIQQALRLGAIDYISKLQLENENVGPVLENLRSKVLEHQISSHTPATSKLLCPSDTCWLLSCTNGQNPQPFLEQCRNLLKERPIEIMLNVYAWYPQESYSSTLPFPIAQPWYVLRINGLSGQEQEEFFHLVRRYYRQYMFYRHENMVLSLHDLKERLEHPASVTDHEMNKLLAQWQNADWLYNRKTFEQMLSELRELTLPFHMLFQLLSKIEDFLQDSYDQILTDADLKLPYTFCSWEEVQDWLQKVFDCVSLWFLGNQFSIEILKSLNDALKLIEKELASPLTVRDVAARVNMSRSYFSLCFKKITGISFNQYVRNKRMEMAKQYLENTNLTIMQIAEKTGYDDEKYFSKVFKQETGMLPTAWRRTMQKP